MTDFRRFPKSETRQLIDYNRFMSLTGTKLFVCLDKGVIEIARYLLNSRGSWRTTYVKEYVGTIGYEMPTEEEFENVLHAIAESNEDMSSCDDIVNALTGIQGAIEASTSAGSSGCGCVMGGDTPLEATGDQNPSAEPDREGPPPTGSGSWAIYDQHKCNWTMKWLDDYIGTLRNYGGLFGVLGGLTVAVIAGLTLLVVPPVGLAIIMAALGSLLLLDIGLFASFTTIANYFEDNKQEIACDVTSKDDTAEMITAIEAWIDAAIATITGLPPGVDETLKTVCLNLVSNTSLTGIIVNNGNDPTGYEDSTCCEGEDLFFIDEVLGLPAGILTDGDLLISGTIESQPIEFAAAVRQIMVLRSTGSPQDNYFRIDNILSNSGATDYTLDIYDNTPALIFTDTVTNLDDWIGFESPACMVFSIRDSSDYTSTFEIEFSWSETAF